MKPNTNRHERRAGFVAGCAGRHEVPRFRTRAQRRAWWNGQMWARTIPWYATTGVLFRFGAGTFVYVEDHDGARRPLPKVPPINFTVIPYDRDPDAETKT